MVCDLPKLYFQLMQHYNNIITSVGYTYLNHEEPNLRSRMFVAIQDDTHAYCYEDQQYQEHQSSQNTTYSSPSR